MHLKQRDMEDRVDVYQGRQSEAERGLTDLGGDLERAKLLRAELVEGVQSVHVLSKKPYAIASLEVGSGQTLAIGVVRMLLKGLDDISCAACVRALLGLTGGKRPHPVSSTDFAESFSFFSVGSL